MLMEFANEVVMPIVMISFGITVMTIFAFLSSLVISLIIKEFRHMWRK